MERVYLSYFLHDRKFKDQRRAPADNKADIQTCTAKSEGYE